MRHRVCSEKSLSRLSTLITEKIWGLIREIVSAIADFFSTDFDELLTNIINENKTTQGDDGRGPATTTGGLNHLRNLKSLFLKNAFISERKFSFGLEQFELLVWSL